MSNTVHYAMLSLPQMAKWEWVLFISSCFNLIRQLKERVNNFFSSMDRLGATGLTNCIKTYECNPQTILRLRI